MYKRELCSAAKYPDNIHERVAVKIRTHRSSEGPERVACYLEELQAKGNADDRNAKNKSDNKMEKSHPEAVK